MALRLLSAERTGELVGERGPAVRAVREVVRVGLVMALAHVIDDDAVGLDLWGIVQGLDSVATHFAEGILTF